MSGEGREVYGSYQLSRAPAACGTCAWRAEKRATKETPKVLRAKSRNRAAHRRAPHGARPSARSPRRSASGQRQRPPCDREYGIAYIRVLTSFKLFYWLKTLNLGLSPHCSTVTNSLFHTRHSPVQTYAQTRRRSLEITEGRSAAARRAPARPHFALRLPCNPHMCAAEISVTVIVGAHRSRSRPLPHSDVTVTPGGGGAATDRAGIIP